MLHSDRTGDKKQLCMAGMIWMAMLQTGYFFPSLGTYIGMEMSLADDVLGDGNVSPRKGWFSRSPCSRISTVPYRMKVHRTRTQLFIYHSKMYESGVQTCSPRCPLLAYDGTSVWFVVLESHPIRRFYNIFRLFVASCAVNTLLTTGHVHDVIKYPTFMHVLLEYR